MEHNQKSCEMSDQNTTIMALKKCYFPCILLNVCTSRNILKLFFGGLCFRYLHFLFYTDFLKELFYWLYKIKLGLI